jgi:hypothetical protein
MRSAAALALSEIFRSLHASGSTPLTFQSSGKQGTSLSGLACMPLFTPIHSSGEDAWAGVAYVGRTQVFFETQVMQLPQLCKLNAQDQIRV